MNKWLTIDWKSIGAVMEGLLIIFPRKLRADSDHHFWWGNSRIIWIVDEFWSYAQKCSKKCHFCQHGRGNPSSITDWIISRLEFYKFLQDILEHNSSLKVPLHKRFQHLRIPFHYASALLPVQFYVCRATMASVIVSVTPTKAGICGTVWRISPSADSTIIA